MPQKKMRRNLMQFGEADLSHKMRALDLHFSGARTKIIDGRNILRRIK